jgi:hypothetical protein
MYNPLRFFIMASDNTDPSDHSSAKSQYKPALLSQNELKTALTQLATDYYEGPLPTKAQNVPPIIESEKIWQKAVGDFSKKIIPKLDTSIIAYRPIERSLHRLYSAAHRVNITLPNINYSEHHLIADELKSLSNSFNSLSYGAPYQSWSNKAIEDATHRILNDPIAQSAPHYWDDLTFNEQHIFYNHCAQIIHNSFEIEGAEKAPIRVYPYYGRHRNEKSYETDLVRYKFRPGTPFDHQIAFSKNLPIAFSHIKTGLGLLFSAATQARQHELADAVLKNKISEEHDLYADGIKIIYLLNPQLRSIEHMSHMRNNHLLYNEMRSAKSESISNLEKHLPI